MSRFDDLLSDEPDEPVRGNTMGGAFSCQHCDEVITQAVHDSREDTLTWKCTQGHVSRIGFRI